MPSQEGRREHQKRKRFDGVTKEAAEEEQGRSDRKLRLTQTHPNVLSVCLTFASSANVN